MKRFLSALLIIVLVTGTISVGYAYGFDKHSAMLNTILFGSEIVSLTAKQEELLSDLQCAVYLALDQYNGHGADELTNLIKKYRADRLPSTLEDINFKGNQYHRAYTHRGWNHVYVIDKANWPARKEILLDVTEEVFDFRLISGDVLGVNFGYDEKCEAFAELMYYVHVLGDYEAQTTWKNNVMIPFARPNASENNPDLLWDLTHCLKVLFQEQEKTRLYKDMLGELGKNANAARLLAGSWGGINSDEKFNEQKGIVKECIKILNEHVHKLLKEEDFWTDVFS